jgi:hypothetical protein
VALEELARFLTDYRDDFAFLANIATTLALLVGIFFGVRQLRNAAEQAREASTLELIRRMHSDQWSADLAVLRRPVNDPPDFTQPEVYAAARRVCLVYETIGVMVCRHAMHAAVVFELNGPAYHWAVLSKEVAKWREAENAPDLYEWFEWLAARHEQYLAIQRARAPAAHANWRPQERSLRKKWPRQDKHRAVTIKPGSAEALQKAQPPEPIPHEFFTHK